MSRWNETAGSGVLETDYARKVGPRGPPPPPLGPRGVLGAHPGSPGCPSLRIAPVLLTRTGAVPFLDTPRAVICLTSLQWCRITSFKECHGGFREPAATVRIRLSWRGDSP